eukprot:scaffold152426_cov27-Tisochrysis_lutea.AAC.2
MPHVAQAPPNHCGLIVDEVEEEEEQVMVMGMSPRPRRRPHASVEAFVLGCDALGVHAMLCLRL